MLVGITCANCPPKLGTSWIYGLLYSYSNTCVCIYLYRYLREYQALGTAGGIYHFRDEILRNKPEQFYVLHADIACSFPLNELYQAHMKHRGLCTILSTKVPKEQSLKFGCLIAKPETNEVLHYVEKPEFFLSQLISCGVYLFDTGIFGEIQKAMERKKDQAAEDDMDGSGRDEKLRLEQDLISPLSASHKLYMYETHEFWRQIKTAGSAVPANAAFLEQFSKQQPERLRKRGVAGGPEIIGAVYIHPSAQIDPTAKVRLIDVELSFSIRRIKPCRADML